MTEDALRHEVSDQDALGQLTLLPVLLERGFAVGAVRVLQILLRLDAVGRDEEIIYANDRDVMRTTFSTTTLFSQSTACIATFTP